MPITPFPTLFTAPVYRSANNTVELTVSNFFYQDPKTKAQTTLDVYLGNLGPLRHRVYQASSPGPLTSISPFVHPMAEVGGTSSDGSPTSPGVTPRYLQSSPLHTIVIVEMPPLTDVIKALEEDAVPPSSDSPGSNQHTPSAEGAPNGGAHSPPSIAGRSLPLLFIRASDGVGYHSGRTIACENMFQGMDMANMAHPSSGPSGSIDTGWLAAAQAAAVADGGVHGWTLRVM